MKFTDHLHLCYLVQVQRNRIFYGGGVGLDHRNNHCIYTTESDTPMDIVIDLFFCLFVFLLCEEEGATTFRISHRTISRKLKLARIAVTKTVGSDGMSYFFLLFISPFSRRLLSPIRDVRQCTTNAARFVIYCVKL